MLPFPFAADRRLRCMRRLKTPVRTRKSKGMATGWLHALNPGRRSGFLYSARLINSTPSPKLSKTGSNITHSGRKCGDRVKDCASSKQR